ncbi:MFS transporter [Pseudomonas sp. AFG_SD02_1510_Pfu_092]|uniref:MFS transporter n=1 Tax=Pseudomonas sp. AFG_SD02_1510_Pfu_092 TaxID=2259497 RepID=UPI000DEFE88D|nr:MFS transporter [Pseudomonas sp. AFG_SD02_1510_Pfu_092]RCL28487.1 MFS transporter [Pseudomonas sp. AFG_SD02_1510_Pfu_092]
MHAQPSGPASSRSALRTFCVSGLGTALEFYDFIIYGTAAALVFPQVFFPQMDHLTATLLAFSAFGAGFLARPLGGLVFGHFGDRLGRQKVLVSTLLLMGLSTFLIGCLPGHASVGVAAPILLVLLRLIQGFAAGGEWGGAALFGIESAPAGRRGLWGSFTSMGIGVGGILGAGVFAIVSAAYDDNLVDFAWRIPFWLGGSLVLIGLYARLKAPVAATAPLAKPVRAPLAEALRQRPRQLLLCTGIAFGYCTIAYIGSTFFLTYATQVGFGSTEALMFDLALSVAIVLSAPLCGYLSDRLGRRTVMGFGAGAMALGLFAFFPLVSMHSFVVALCAYSLTGLLMGATQGPIPAFLAEQFPRSMRYSGISASYQIGAALGGGSASSVATAILILTDHQPLGVALYGAGALALVALCSLMLRETSRLSMAQIDEQAPILTGAMASNAQGANCKSAE